METSAELLPRIGLHCGALRLARRDLVLSRRHLRLLSRSQPEHPRMFGALLGHEETPGFFLFDIYLSGDRATQNYQGDGVVMPLWTGGTMTGSKLWVAQWRKRGSKSILGTFGVMGVCSVVEEDTRGVGVMDLWVSVGLPDFVLSVGDPMAIADAPRVRESSLSILLQSGETPQPNECIGFLVEDVVRENTVEPVFTDERELGSKLVGSWALGESYVWIAAAMFLSELMVVNNRKISRSQKGERGRTVDFLVVRFGPRSDFLPCIAFISGSGILREKRFALNVRVEAEDSGFRTGAISERLFREVTLSDASGGGGSCFSDFETTSLVHEKSMIDTKGHKSNKLRKRRKVVTGDLVESKLQDVEGSGQVFPLSFHERLELMSNEIRELYESLDLLSLQAEGKPKGSLGACACLDSRKSCSGRCSDSAQGNASCKDTGNGSSGHRDTRDKPSLKLDNFQGIEPGKRHHILGIPEITNGADTVTVPRIRSKILVETQDETSEDGHLHLARQYFGPNWRQAVLGGSSGRSEATKSEQIVSIPRLEIP